LLLAAAIFVACGTSDRNSDKQIFRYNESAGIASLDPAFAKDQAMIWASQQLFNGLIQLDTDLTVQPAIAKRWEISDDGLTYTFILRRDVYFHRNVCFADGRRRVVASDFVYSFNRIVDEKVASPGRWIFDNVAVTDGSYAFSAPNDTTFVVTLKQPFAPFLGMMGMPYCSVVPHEAVEHFGADFRQNPVGTGPFRFQKWKEGVKLVLQRNPNYFERDDDGNRLPYLDAIAVTFIVDKQTVFLEFVKGNLDFMNSLDASYKDELLTRTGQLREKYAEGIDMVSLPFLNTEYLGFQMEKNSNVLKDKRVRQAINCAFDRRKMMKYLRNNVGLPGCYGFIPAGLPGFDTTAGYEYDLPRAKRLLAEAGYPNGKGLPTLTLSTTSSYLDLCKYVQQQLGLAGIKTEIDVNPPGALREQIAQSKVQWFRGSWIADYPDAENYLSLFYSKNFCPQGPNYTHFSSKEFDRLYLQSKAETNDSVRAELYKRMNAIVIDEAPVVVLYYDQILHFTHKNVKGLRSNAMNALDLRKVKIES
jgi:peptide/nickel transport system substrate-binding protein